MVNREILFRGKRVDNGEWIEGSFLNFRENNYIIPHDSEYCYDDTEKFAFDIEHFEVIHETVRQFTGLTDKNGRKIFEGDICVFKNVFSEKPHIGLVRYYAGAKPISDNGRHVVDLAECNPEDLEIIGNIHDNPELLKG